MRGIKILKILSITIRYPVHDYLLNVRHSRFGHLAVHNIQELFTTATWKKAIIGRTKPQSRSTKKVLYLGLHVLYLYLFLGLDFQSC